MSSPERRLTEGQNKKRKTSKNLPEIARQLGVAHVLEGRGCGDVHLVRNEGIVTAMDVAVQIVPAGALRRIDADQPASCPVITCP
jgi:hypothetical protein